MHFLVGKVILNYIPGVFPNYLDEKECKVVSRYVVQIVEKHPEYNLKCLLLWEKFGKMDLMRDTWIHYGGC